MAKIEEEESSSQDDVEVGEAAQNLSTNTVGMHDAGIIQCCQISYSCYYTQPLTLCIIVHVSSAVFLSLVFDTAIHLVSWPLVILGLSQNSDKSIYIYNPNTCTFQATLWEKLLLGH